ncbi:pickpocket, partial [Culex quinquefasciatus]
MDLLHTCAEESSVHGLSHLVVKDRHWFERVAWAVIVALSIYCSYAVYMSTWTR